MSNETVEKKYNHGFFTGLVTGATLAASLCYLILTKPGRRLLRSILKYAEELGEKGEKFLSDSEKNKKQIISIIDKLKSAKTTKKSVDNKKRV